MSGCLKGSGLVRCMARKGRRGGACADKGCNQAVVNNQEKKADALSAVFAKNQKHRSRNSYYQAGAGEQPEPEPA